MQIFLQQKQRHSTSVAQNNCYSLTKIEHSVVCCMPPDLIEHKITISEEFKACTMLLSLLCVITLNRQK